MLPRNIAARARLIHTSIKSGPQIQHSSSVRVSPKLGAVFTNKHPSRALQQSHHPRQSARVMPDQLDNAATSSKTEIERAAALAKNEQDGEALPELTPGQYRVYNGIAENMAHVHGIFRRTWQTIYTACTNNQLPAEMDEEDFLSLTMNFCHQLSMHHSVEENHVFPILAERMPDFKPGQDTAELLEQHRQIHDGMEVLQEYLAKVKFGDAELDLPVMKEKIEFWADVLLRHLDDEVVSLGAEKMRKYWTLAEMSSMPMGRGGGWGD